jgi:hypothetical protein
LIDKIFCHFLTVDSKFLGLLVERQIKCAKNDIAEEILLVIEVSDTTLTFDQTIKLKLYAEAGISDYWIANLNAQQLERYSQPYQTAQGEFQYRSKQISLPNETVPIPGFTDTLLDLSKIFPESTIA